MSALREGRIVCFGEMLIRLSAPGAELLLQKPRLDVSYGGAEANVAVSLAQLGRDARMVSTVPDNALGRAAVGELRRHGVEVRGVATGAGRMGLYFLSPGAGVRASEITYDRAHSAFASSDFASIDWAKHLDGAALLHVSGVTAALGRAAADGVIRAVSEARKRNVAVSFDCNYRAKLWEAWKGDAPGVLREILVQADMMFGDHRDISLVLGKAIAPGRAAADAAFAAWPSLARIAHTGRVQHSVGRHDLSAAMHTRDGETHAPPIAITEIVDRIGGGDAFAAGLIHALMAGKGDEDALRFALAAAALKHTIPGDFNLAREDEIEAVAAGAALDVRR